MKKSTIIILLLIVIILLLALKQTTAFTSMLGGGGGSSNNTWAGHNIVYNNTYHTVILDGTSFSNDSLGNAELGRNGVAYSRLQTSGYIYLTSLYPVLNNVITLGNSTHRWSRIWVNRFGNFTYGINASHIRLGGTEITSWNDIKNTTWSGHNVVYGSNLTGYVKNNTQQKKVYLNDSLGVWISDLLQSSYAWFYNNVTMGNTGKYATNVSGAGLVTHGYSNATRYSLMNGSNFNNIYGAGRTSSFTNGTSINTTRTYANDFYFGNGTSIKSVFVSEDLNNKTYPKLAFRNGTAINVSYISANKFCYGNGTCLNTMLGGGGSSNNTWAGHNLLSNNTNQGKIYENTTNYYIGNKTYYSNYPSALTWAYPNGTAYMRYGENILLFGYIRARGLVMKYDSGAYTTNLMGFIDPRLNTFSGIYVGGGAVIYYSDSAPVIITQSSGLQLGSAYGYPFVNLETENKKSLVIAPRTGNDTNYPYTVLIQNGFPILSGAGAGTSLGPNYKSTDLLRINENYVSPQIITPFGVMTNGSGVYIARGGKYYLNGRRSGAYLMYEPVKSNIVLSYSNQTNVTRINNNWFNVTVGKKVFINTTLEVKKNLTANSIYVNGSNNYLTMRPQLYAGRIKNPGTPTFVTIGAFAGYSMPASVPSDSEDLFFREHVPGRRMDPSNYTVYMDIALVGAEDVADEFTMVFMYSFTNMTMGSLFSATNRSVNVTQAILTNRNAANSVYRLEFPINANGIRNGDLFGGHLWRKATAGTEITGEVMIADIYITYKVDKVYKNVGTI